MRPSIRLALPLLALFLPPLAACAQEPKAIVEKAIQAHGGAAALDKQDKTGLSFKSKGKVYLPGLEIEFTSKSIRVFPDRMRQDIEADVNGQAMKMTAAVGPKGAWMAVNESAQEMPESQQASMKHELHAANLYRLTPLLKEAVKLESVGSAELDGKKVLGVKASVKDQPDVKLWFDADSGLLVKSEYKTVDQQGEEISQESFFKDHKDFDGVKRFTKMNVNRKGEKYLEIEASDFKPEDKVDEKLFEKP